MPTTRKPEYKPLLYTTTIRNPERVKALLYVFAKFDGQILTDELATEIVGEPFGMVYTVLQDKVVL